MMIDLCNKLIDNDLTREELLERVTIKKTSIEDLEDICNTLARSFDLSSPKEALFQLEHSNAILSESVKLVDKDSGEIYGLLIFCEYPIQDGSPIRFVEHGLAESLNGFKQINGHSFIIDERLRNSGLDKKMLSFNEEFILGNYDFIWIGVEIDLRSHLYWQRMGFSEVFRIDEAVFYLMPLNKKFLLKYLYRKISEQ